MADENIIVYTDKTVVKVQGLDVKGLDTRALEKILMDKFHSVVRVIGVTGSSIDMDIYGIDPEQIQKDEHGLIQAISTTEGVTATGTGETGRSGKKRACRYQPYAPA